MLGKPKSIGWLALLAVVACGQVPEEPESQPAPSPATTPARSTVAHEGRPATLAARVKSDAEGDALVADPDYRASRAISEAAMRERYGDLVRRLGFDAHETAELERIMAEHVEARLEMQDFLVRTRGMTRVERMTRLENGIGVPRESFERSKPSALRDRILRTLGKQRLDQFNELVVNLEQPARPTREGEPASANPVVAEPVAPRNVAER